MKFCLSEHASFLLHKPLVIIMIFMFINMFIKRSSVKIQRWKYSVI